MSEPIPNIIEPFPPLPNYRLEDIHDTLKQTCLELGWGNLTLVQEKAIPYILNATDLITQSKTGSGKTGAFLLPLIQVMKAEHIFPQTLVLLPTRELALQVVEQFEILAKSTDLKCIAVYGGTSYEKQVNKLKEGVHIVIGTPGRILDHLKQETLDLSNIRDLVLDEADEMLSMGFYPDMQQIQNFLPKKENRCSYLFSATMPQIVLSLAKEFLNDYKLLNLCTEGLTIPKMNCSYYLVNPMEKDKLLFDFLQYQNPESVIVFCNTKKDVQYLFDFLKSRKISIGMLSGDVPQKERECVLKKIKERSLRFLIATDIAARGIDIKNLSHVIHYNHPLETETYIHRSGRTARANQTGSVVSFVTELEEIQLKRTQDKYNFKIQKKDPPSNNKMQGVLKNKLLDLLQELNKQTSVIEKKQHQWIQDLVEEKYQDKDFKALLISLLCKFNLSPQTYCKSNEN